MKLCGKALVVFLSVCSSAVRSFRLGDEDSNVLSGKTEAASEHGATLTVAKRHVLAELKSVSESSAIPMAATTAANSVSSAGSSPVPGVTGVAGQQIPVEVAYQGCVTANWAIVAIVVGGLYYIVAQLVFANAASGSPSPQSSSVMSMLFGLGPFVLVWYCFFSVSHTFFQHQAAHVNLNPVVPTILIYLLKLVLALTMWRCSDGTFSDLIIALGKNKSAVMWYLLPAACLAFYDLLSFMTLARLSPAQYQILLHLRTVLIALVWQIVMSKRLTMTQWALLGSCIYAAMLTEREALSAMVSGGMLATTLGPYMTLCMQYGLSITGNLSNEKFLKQVDLSVNAQNIVLYTLGAGVLTVTLIVKTLVSGPVFTAQDIPKIFETSVFMSILTLGLVGISTGFVLKLMGNIWKELAGMVVTFTAAGIDWFVLKSRKADVIDCQAVVIVALSLGIYSLLEKKYDLDAKKAASSGNAEKKLAGS